jgi:hypothetical protein
MSTVSMILEEAERHSKDCAVAQNAAQTPRQHPKERAQDEREGKKDEVNNAAVFRR